MIIGLYMYTGTRSPPGSNQPPSVRAAWRRGDGNASQRRAAGVRVGVDSSYDSSPWNAMTSPILPAVDDRRSWERERERERK